MMEVDRQVEGEVGVGCSLWTEFLEVAASLLILSGSVQFQSASVFFFLLLQAWIGNDF